MSVALPGAADVVVLGGGLAGHCAALAAAEQGAAVVLIEKTASHGGSTVQSSGTFAFAGTDLQQSQGIEDSNERLAQDILKAGSQRNDPELVGLYLREQRETFDWLRGHHVAFHPLALSSSMSVPRSHPTDPHQLMEVLNQCVRGQPGIVYATSTRVSGLLTEGGRVLGIQLEDGRKLAARHGVVLATGGFPRSPELIRKYAPRLANALAVGGSGCEGDGLRMAQLLGADVTDMDFITGTFGMSLNRYPETTVTAEDQPLLRLAIFRGAIAVNLDAQRFTDESISYKIIGEHCLAQPKGVAFQVFDQRIMDQSVPAPTSNDYRGAYAQGLIRKADSIAGLASMVGLDPARLEATLQHYNADARRGTDSQFGRTSLGGGYGTLVPLEQPPFYIFPCTTGILGTYCGLRVNASLQVIRADGQPIAGLTAAGEIVGGLHGSGYMSGTALAKAAIFGRVAGEALARAALNTPRTSGASLSRQA